MKNDRSGVRFRNEHIRARRSGRPAWARILGLGLAIISTAIGVVLVFIPGPAFVFFILAGALLASQWWALACLLDRAELMLLKAWKRLRNLAKSLVPR